MPPLTPDDGVEQSTTLMSTNKIRGVRASAPILRAAQHAQISASAEGRARAEPAAGPAVSSASCPVSGRGPAVSPDSSNWYFG